jgi:hypothetical protein
MFRQHCLIAMPIDDGIKPCPQSLAKSVAIFFGLECFKKRSSMLYSFLSELKMSEKVLTDADPDSRASFDPIASHAQYGRRRSASRGLARRAWSRTGRFGIGIFVSHPKDATFSFQWARFVGSPNRGSSAGSSTVAGTCVHSLCAGSSAVGDRHPLA